MRRRRTGRHPPSRRRVAVGVERRVEVVHFRRLRTVGGCHADRDCCVRSRTRSVATRCRACSRRPARRSGCSTNRCRGWTGSSRGARQGRGGRPAPRRRGRGAAGASAGLRGGCAPASATGVDATAPGTPTAAVVRPVTTMNNGMRSLTATGRYGAMRQCGGQSRKGDRCDRAMTLSIWSVSWPPRPACTPRHSPSCAAGARRATGCGSSSRSFGAWARARRPSTTESPHSTRRAPTSRTRCLGPRLLECTRAANAVADRSADEIFGTPDDLKFRSSMTLFAAASPNTAEFAAALDRYFAGGPDPRTWWSCSAVNDECRAAIGCGGARHGIHGGSRHEIRRSQRSPMSAIGLGCWQFGSRLGLRQRVREQTAIDLVHAALDGRDPDPHRGGLPRGVSERSSARHRGTARAGVRGHEDDARDADRVDGRRPRSAVRVRLGVDRIDLYQCTGRIPPCRSPRRWRDASAAGRGTRRDVGVSNYSAALGGRGGGLDGRCCRTRCSTACCGGAPTDRRERPVRAESQAVVIAYSPLAKGLLGGRYDPDHAVERAPARPVCLRENVERAMPVIEPRSESRPRTGRRPRRCRWRRSSRGRTVAIPGASSIEQLRRNVEARDLDLSADELAELTAVSDAFVPLAPPQAAMAMLARAACRGVVERAARRGSRCVNDGAPVDLERDVVDVAVPPVLAGLVRLDERMLVAWKCAVAWRFGELSQQPT